MNKKITYVIASGLALTLMTGCARNISPNVYKASAVGETSFTYQGSVISARQVQVQEHEKLGDNGTGIALGGLAGGLAGSQMGGGKGNLAMMGLGAIAGATAGAFAEKALTDQNGMEYAVRLTNGQIMTVVQGLDMVYAVGQRVLVMVSHDGRSRIVPDNSPPTAAAYPQPMINAPQVVVKKDR